MTGCSDAATVELLFDKMYEGFIEEVDAVDNGVSQFDGEPRCACSSSRHASHQRRYKVTSTIGRRVGALNPAWNEADQNTDVRRHRDIGQLMCGRLASPAPWSWWAVSLWTG